MSFQPWTCQWIWTGALSRKHSVVPVEGETEAHIYYKHPFSPGWAVPSHGPGAAGQGGHRGEAVVSHRKEWPWGDP